MKELTQAEKGYLAGIIDGEGALIIRHQNGHRSYYAVTQVCNTDIKMISYLLEITGIGKIASYSTEGNRKQAYKWTVFRKDDLYALLDATYPYLITKRERADLLYRLREIKLQPLVRKGINRGKWILSDEVVSKCSVLFEKMRELNYRGLNEKRGELLENPNRTISSQAEVGISQKVQRLTTESRTDSNVDTSALSERNDIVRASEKSEEV